MAKTITDEVMRLNIIVDGNEAQKQLHDLEKSTRDVTRANKDLRKEKLILEAEGKKETARYKEVTAEIRKNNQILNENKERTAALQKEIGVMGLTMSQLKAKATELRMALNHVIPGSEAHKKYTTELNEINGRLDQLKINGSAAGNSIGGLADKFNRYSGLAATVIATGTGIALTMKSVIDYNAKLSDAQADVMKTTGMTKTQVEELQATFSDLGTRTSTMDLLGIAEEGGRAGIPTNEITEFVSVMDKAAVALGDSFTGGASEVANKLGTIKFLFQETKDMGVEDSYMAIGSAINELGANGNASEGNIANFTNRIGSIPDVMKPTIAETMALGAAFEESGIEAEVSARAYGIFLKQASTETDKFAQVMNLSKTQIEEMINTNPLEFFLKFSKQLADGAKKGTDMAKVLDHLGLNADGVNKIVGAAGNNVNRFRELVDISNDSFTEANSLLNEYNIKNNNFAATMEKIGKKVSGAFSSEGLVNFLTDSAEWFAKLIGAVDEGDKKFQAYRNTLAFVAKLIAIVTAAIMTNVAWQKMAAMWTTRNTTGTLLYTVALRANAISQSVATAGTHALAIAKALLTGNMVAARTATLAFSAALKTTPWGLVAAAVGAVTVAYALFADKQKQINAIQKNNLDIEREATKSIITQKTEMEQLVKIAKDKNLSDETRARAIRELNKIIPDHIGLLTLENIATKEGKELLAKYNDELFKQAKLKAAQRKQDELLQKKVEVSDRTSKYYNSTADNVSESIWGLFGIETNQYSDKQQIEDYVNKNNPKLSKLDKDALVMSIYKQSGISKKDAEIKSLDDQLKALEAELLAGKTSSLNNPEDPIGEINLDLTGGKSDKTKTKSKKDDFKVKELERLNDELLKLRRKSEEDAVAIMQDGYEKQMAQERVNHKYKILELKDQLSSEENLKKIDTEIASAQKAGDSPKVKALQSIRDLLIAKNKEINKQIESEETLHQLRIGTIQQKGGRSEIDLVEDRYNRKKAIREAAFYEELNQLDLQELERKKRIEAFNEQEKVYQVNMLQEQLEALNIAVKKGAFNGIDFDLLTEEQMAEFQKEIEAVELALAKLNAAKNGDSEREEIDLGLGGPTDVLGFTQEQWENFYKNIEQGTIGIQTMMMAVTAMKNIYAQFDAFQTASENAQLKKYERSSDSKKKALKRQLDEGYINQATYKKRIEEIDADLDKKKAELEYKQAKRQRQLALVEAIVNTAQAVTNMLKTSGPVGFVLAALAAAMGAFQIATIAKQPLPAKGYEEGLYPSEYMVKREQDGKLFKAKHGGNTKSGMVNSPTHFLAGENGPEMIIDSKSYANLSPTLKDALANELRGIKGFEKGYYKDGVFHTDNQSSQNRDTSNSDEILEFALAIINGNTEAIKDLRDNGVTAIVSPKDYKSIKELSEALKKYESLKPKAKI